MKQVPEGGFERSPFLTEAGKNEELAVTKSPTGTNRTGSGGAAVNVLIISRSISFTVGLERLILADPRISATVVGTDVEEVRPPHISQAIGVVVFDVDVVSETTTSAIRIIRSNYPESYLIIMPDCADLDQAVLALKAGSRGCVPKTLDPKEMESALAHVFSGQIYISPVGQSANRERFGEGTESKSKVARLTPRQLQILRLINCGKSRRRIAKELGLTENTVKVHANSAYRVLGISSRVAIADILNVKMLGDERPMPDNPLGRLPGLERWNTVVKDL